MRNLERVSLGRLLRAIAISAALSACSEPPSATICTSELRVQLSPSDTSVPAGRAFTIGARLSGCSGKVQLEDVFTFDSTEPAVATVDATSGRVTAVTAGEARIAVTGERYGSLGFVRVMVAP